MLLSCVCITLLRGDDACGTVWRVADEGVAAAAAAAWASCALRPLPPMGVAACCASVMTVSKGESDMANTMRWRRSGTDACGECAGRGEERVASGRNGCGPSVCSASAACATAVRPCAQLNRRRSFRF